MSRVDAATEGRLRAGYGKLPLSFEANQGQVDKRVKFLARGHGYTLFLTSDAAVMTLQAGAPNSPAGELNQDPANQDPSNEDGAVLRMKMVGAAPSARISGIDEQQGKTHYLTGNDPNKWRTNVVNYSRVRYQDAYPGVDLIYYGNQQQLEYDFVVAPGADPRSILLDLEVEDLDVEELDFESRGAQAAHQHPAPHSTPPFQIAANGDLLVSMRGRDVRFTKPIVYQGAEVFSGLRKDEDRNSASNLIDGRWVRKGPTRVGFEVGAYDTSRPLIIDPALNYSTYLGGSVYDTAFGLTLDSAGNAYVTGDTLSTDFPTQSPFRAHNAGSHDAFVTKLNASGTGLVYSTYLGGGAYDRAVGIAVDSLGNAYVVGTTGSKDLPVTAGAFQTVCTGCSQGSSDAFVSKLNPTGSALIYSTYLGGTGSDYGSAISLDGSGHAFVAGRTCSADFPVTSGAFQTAYAGGCSGTLGGDAYVTELNATGSALIYSSYLGGSGVDAAYAIAVDPLGNAYVSGNTNSHDFPTTSGAFQTQNGGGFDTFVAKVNPSGSALVYATYIGGSGDETTWGIKVDSSGNAYLAGQTMSPNFPTTVGAFQTVCGGTCSQIDGFVTKVNATGSSLSYSTYLGGSGEDVAFALAVDSGGAVYVTGETGSTTDFPTTAGSFQPKSSGGVEAFITRLNAAGSSLLYSTYFGNSATTGLAIAVNNQNHSFVVAGRTYSTVFPATPGAFSTKCPTCTQVNKASDGFITQFIVGDQIWPLTLNFGDQVVGINSPAHNAVLTNSSTLQLNTSSILISGTNSSDFIKVKDTCSVPVLVGASCTISVVLKPSAPGPENAILTVTDDAANSPQQVILQGAGTYIQLIPTSIGFPKQKVGTQSLPKLITVTNKGPVTVNISGIGLTGANFGDFAQTNTCASTLQPAASCTITVTFTPTATGARTAAASVSDDAGGSPQQVTLTGSGS